MTSLSQRRRRRWGISKRVTKAKKRLLERRKAVEASIGHLKAAHRLPRNCFKGAQGDAMNPIPAAAGFNFRWLMQWIALFRHWSCGAVMGLVGQSELKACSAMASAAA